MRTIAIVNQKGGSGKTTTAVNLAASLAEAGKKILLIDLDPQASASLWYGFKEQGKALYDALAEECCLSKAISKTSWDNLEIVPASSLLAGMEKALANTVAAEMVLKDRISKLGSAWDYALIDCPPTLGVLSLNALTASEEVLIPVETHVMALHGLVQLLKTINLVKQRLNPALEIAGILPCRVDQRTKHSQEIVSQLCSRFEGKVYRASIRENIRLAEAPLHCKPITSYDSSSNGAHDYRNLAQEVIAQEKGKSAI